MTSKIKAAIRLRPFLKSEIQNGYSNNYIRVANHHEVQVRDGNNRKAFTFDHIFDTHSTQEQVYQSCEIDNMVTKCLQGYHSTIFAYGQTGSGKTFTMHGEQQSGTNGIIPKLFGSLFGQIRQNKERTFMVSLSFLQIYSQKIYDLLNPASGINQKGAPTGGLRLRWSKDEQFTVQNLFVFDCRDQQDLMSYFTAGLKNRISASHRLNLQSSRSHSILTIRVESFDPFNPSSRLTSRLQLVDLAGSERIGLTGTQGKQAKESIDINKSLFTLRQVISVLSESGKKIEKQKIYVPYRDSKLTSILKQSIGGNSYCLMIACINPHDFFLDQNLSTLTYATKASYITNQPIVNDDPQAKIVNQLKKQVKGLTQQLMKANKHIQLINSMQKMQVQEPPIHQNTYPMGMSAIKRTGSQRTNPQQNSQRLVESINMVRELLKSNKELREKLELANQRNDQKDLQIFQMSRETQYLKQKLQGKKQEKEVDWNPPSTSNIRSSSVQVKRRASTRGQNRPKNIAMQYYPTQQPIHVMGHPNSNPMIEFGGGNLKNNCNYWNSVEINQYYMNQRGVDSVPTNFSRKQISSSHQHRQYQRNPSMNERRSALTAKISQRRQTGNLTNQGGKFFSFYQQGEM